METPTASPAPVKLSIFTRICRWLFSWRMVRGYLVVLATLITLIVCYYTEERWRGKRAWENYRSQLIAQGAELDWKNLGPPPVPDDQNFAMTPFLAPLFNFNSEPLQPGQSAWRDTNGFNRAKDFGKGVPLDLSKPGDAGAFPDLNQEPDFELVLQYPVHQKLPGVAAGPFASRADAAAELLKQFAAYRPVLDELRAASQRPYSRFNIQYDAEDPAEILVPHLGVLRHVEATLAYQASAELTTGKTDAAFADVELMLYLPGAIRNEPIIISQLVRMVMLEQTATIIHEGIAVHGWSDEQLRKFADELGRVSLFTDMEKSFYGERLGFGDRTLELMRECRGNFYTDQLGIGPQAKFNLIRLYPTGWTYFDELNYNLMLDEQLTGYDPKAALVHPKAIDAADSRVNELKSAGLFSLMLSHRLIATMALSNSKKLMQKTAVGQTIVDECAVACALERFRIANGKYPDSLDALAPKFLAAIPHDVITGEPLKYHVTGDNQFVLYSVGWNETDDGGKTVMTGDGKEIDADQGDWVWPAYQAK